MAPERALLGIYYVPGPVLGSPLESCGAGLMLQVMRWGDRLVAPLSQRGAGTLCSPQSAGRGVWAAQCVWPGRPLAAALHAVLPGARAALGWKRSGWRGKSLLRAHRGPACCGSTSSELALPVRPRGFAGTPPWLYAPPRLPWRRLVHSFPFPPPSPGVPRPPRWEPARSGRGRAPMNSGVLATLAVRRVTFFGRHGGEVRPSGLCPDSRLWVQSGSWFCVVGVPECSLGISLGYGV